MFVSTTSALSVCVAALALCNGVNAAPGCYTAGSVGKAIYFITNDDTNSVVALPIGTAGTLSKGTVIPTGGKGSVGISKATNEKAIGDGLTSQSAITISGNYLFAVNPGSNTVSMFSISKRDPTHLTMVGKPAKVPGDFPNTVAALEDGNVVCVATSGAKAGVSCAKYGDAGIGPMDDLRVVELNQTTPPIGPTNTISQVLFSENGSQMYTIVKGTGAANDTGFIAAFDVEPSCDGATVSHGGIRSSPNGTAVLFGSTLIPGTSDMLVTDAAFGAAILSVDEKGVATTVAKDVIAGQKATCWSAISAYTKTGFVSDVALPRLLEVSLKDASILHTVDLTSTGVPGFIDLGAAGEFLYALAPGNETTNAHLVVIDAGDRKLKQSFSLSKLGAGVNSQGMAILL